MRTLPLAFILSALFAMVSSKILWAQDTTRVKLTENISLLFPGIPVKEEIGGSSAMYTLRHQDSTANFMAYVANLQEQAGLDAATLIEAQQDPSFWDQTSEGFVAQMGPDVKLIKKEMKALDGYDIMELTMERPAPDGGGINTLTIYILIDDVYSINIGHTNRSGKADEKVKQAFFNSINIKK